MLRESRSTAVIFGPRPRSVPSLHLPTGLSGDACGGSDQGTIEQASDDGRRVTEPGQSDDSMLWVQRCKNDGSAEA